MVALRKEIQHNLTPFENKKASPDSTNSLNQSKLLAVIKLHISTQDNS